MPKELSGPGTHRKAVQIVVNPGPMYQPMSSDQAQTPERPLGAHLQPVLEQICDGCLTDLHWFRTDWQRSGALTGYATWTDGAEPVDVVVKLPVPPVELRWYQHLTQYDDVCPRLFAGGSELAGYDIAWVVIERLSHGPLGPKWGGAEFDLLVEATGRFYAASSEVPVPQSPPDKDWHAILRLARQAVQKHALADEQHWSAALKKAAKKLDKWLAVWNARPCDHWCHGDLHFGNAMTRAEPPAGPALLFDYACVMPGHWLQDAVYLEHLFWARKDKLAGRRLCSMIARQRKKHGLPVEADWPQWAQVKRALIAMSTPAMLEHDGDPMHVQAALAVLEDAVRN